MSNQGQGLLGHFLIRFCMFYAYTRPRYQVSVYRTIGLLDMRGEMFSCLDFIYLQHDSVLLFAFETKHTIEFTLSLIFSGKSRSLICRIWP